MKHTLFILITALMWMGCRGTRSGDPPVHLNRNMDYQLRYDPQDENVFYADNRAMRMPVAGTVARGTLREDTRFYDGRSEDGAYVQSLPVPATRELILRGQDRFDIFCAPCHGRAGDGDGIITTGGYGFTPAPTFHEERLRGVEDGYLFDVISRGVRTMPAYGHQVPVADRWAIVAYIRALQRSQYAREDDIPPDVRAQVRQSGAATTAGQAPAAESADTTAPDAAGQNDDGPSEGDADADTSANDAGTGAESGGGDR